MGAPTGAFGRGGRKLGGHLRVSGGAADGAPSSWPSCSRVGVPAEGFPERPLESVGFGELWLKLLRTAAPLGAGFMRRAFRRQPTAPCAETKQKPPRPELGVT